MPLVWLRRSSRLVAAVILLTSLWQLPHRAQDDEVCVPAGAEHHDESKHVVTAPSAAHPDHCAVCHWVRWMKPVFTATASTAVPDRPGSLLAAHAASSCPDRSGDRLPARAPPSPSL